MEYIWIAIAFAFALVVRQVGLPSLIGYLLAGFAITVLSGTAFTATINSALVNFGLPLLPGDYALISMPEAHKSILDHLAHIGILLLLFMVGLKLNVKKVVRPEVILPGLVHFAISAAIFTPLIMAVFAFSFDTSIFLAMALGFSSTVLAASVLDSKNELKAFHGRIAIGILIIQDIVALTVMAIYQGSAPSLWALVVLPAIALARPAYYWLIDKSGHDEMLLLCGAFLALVVGSLGFSAVGLSGELGALVLGALVANHAKSSEMAKSLWGFKELFLVFFFLSIGLNGLPTLEQVGFAVVMTALLPLQGLLFFGMLLMFKLKARTSFLASISLTNFSEFGLIVAAAVMPEHTVTIAMCVAFSFLFSAPLNRLAHPLFDKLETFLTRFERKGYHPDEEPLSLGDASILVMGMGRIGRSAYKAINRINNPPVIVGLDSDQEKIRTLQKKGYHALYADAEHGNFWSTLDFSKLESAILAMNCAEACKIAASKLREYGFEGTIVAHARHKDEARDIEAAGADETFLTYQEAGEGLAGHVVIGVRPTQAKRNPNMTCFEDFDSTHPEHLSDEPELVPVT